VTEFIQTNFVRAVAWSLAAGTILEKQRSGALIVIGSVAGVAGAEASRNIALREIDRHRATLGAALQQGVDGALPWTGRRSQSRPVCRNQKA